KGLMGDPSDHIPGIPGVGEKTAIKLLKKFPTVEEVVQQIDQLPGKKLREKVEEHREQALLSKQLATIRCDVPLDFSLDDLTYDGIQQPDDVTELFQRLEFHSLIERIQKITDSPAQQQTPATSIDVEIVSLDQQESYRSFLENQLLSLHIEADQSNPHRGEIVGFACSDGNTQLYVP